MFEKFYQKYLDESFEAHILVQHISGMGHAGDYGDMSASILAIQKHDGTVLTGTLRLSWPVPLDDHAAAFKLFERIGIYRVRLSAFKLDPKNKDTQYQEWCSHNYCLKEVLPLIEGTDVSALEDIKTEYQREVSLEDPILGKLILNKDINLYEGEISWLDDNCMLFIENSDDMTQLLAQAQSLVKDQALNDALWRAHAAKHLLDNAIEWQEDDEDSAYPDGLQESDFIKAISLSELSINEDGSFSAYYNDGDLFYGHVIIVEGQIKDMILEDAYIAG